MRPSRIHAGILVSLILCRPCAYSHSHSLQLSYHVQQILFLCRYPLPYSLSIASPEVTPGRRDYDLDLPFGDERLAVSFLHVDHRSVLITIHCKKEASLMKVKRCTNLWHKNKTSGALSTQQSNGAWFLIRPMT